MKHALRLTVLFVLAIAAPTTAFQRVFPCRVDYRKPASFWDEVTWDPNPGQGVLVGQLDAYPREDVLVLDNRPQGARGVLHLFLGSGDGTFTPHSSQGLPGAAYGLDGADADGDGDIDAVTALRWLGAEDSVAVCRNDGNADFAITSYGVGTSPADVVLRDVSDNPGWPDIVTANYGANTITCRYNDAAGNFPTRQDFATGNGPVAIVVCRMDADEWNDVVTANFGSGDVSVLVNSDGLGLFPEHEEFPAVPYPGDMAAGDLNGDGLSDVVVVSGHSEEQNPIEFLGVLLNDGAGGLLPPVLYRVGEFHYGVRVADLDGDLDLDIVATAIG
ncbi:VCBS repeat-containing protein, partial [candidate division WOR-3 bacterium]|nr:VCBS repeat-containing protein [candidate division WOR-3 bacterium]